MIAIAKFEKYVANTGVFCMIVGKFGYWQEFGPIILFEIE